MLFKNYWMLMDICFHKVDIYQGLVAPSCFKSHTNSSCHDFFPKKKTKKFCVMSGLTFTLSDVTSFLLDNMSGVKKNYIQACHCGCFSTKIDSCVWLIPPDIKTLFLSIKSHEFNRLWKLFLRKAHPATHSLLQWFKLIF